MTRALPVFRRAGDCNRCGDCCRGNPYTGEDLDKDCPHLVRHDDDTTSCDLHGRFDTYWGLGCNVWPSKPEHLAQPHITRCSFRFEEG